MSEMTRIALIVNAFASAVNESVSRDVERALSEAGPVRVLRTTRPGHATDLAREATEGSDALALVVFSGDGVYNEVLNGLGDAGREVPIGFVPGGRTNALPRALGLPRRPVRAARRLAEALRIGRTRLISLGRVNGRRFAFASGVGLDAELVARINALRRASGGRHGSDLAFVRTAFGLLAQHGWRVEPAMEVVGLGRAALVLVANGDPYSYAGPLALHAAPAARFELGLDVVAPRQLIRGSVARFLGYLLLGRGQQRAADIGYLHDVDHVEVLCDRPMPLHVDGEDMGEVTAAVYDCERAALRVLI
jgi:diacylglycerol kinase family enzyme